MIEDTDDVPRECPSCGAESVLSTREASRVYPRGLGIHPTDQTQLSGYAIERGLAPTVSAQEHSEATHVCSACRMWWDYSEIEASETA